MPFQLITIKIHSNIFYNFRKLSTNSICVFIHMWVPLPEMKETWQIKNSHIKNSLHFLTGCMFLMSPSMWNIKNTSLKSQYMYVYRYLSNKKDSKYIKNYFYLKYKTFWPAFAGYH